MQVELESIHKWITKKDHTAKKIKNEFNYISSRDCEGGKVRHSVGSKMMYSDTKVFEIKLNNIAAYSEVYESQPSFKRDIKFSIINKCKDSNDRSL